ncbi:hypothetical protein C366_00924, partial [Cryptococcus neoformans Tu401-1]
MDEGTEGMEEGTEGVEEDTDGVEEDTDGHMAKELVDAWRTQVSIARMNEG